MNSPLETICVGIGERKAATSAGSVCSRSLFVNHMCAVLRDQSLNPRSLSRLTGSPPQAAQGTPPGVARAGANALVGHLHGQRGRRKTVPEPDPGASQPPREGRTVEVLFKESAPT